MKTYSTIQGDTWDLISVKMYQDEAHTGILITANPDHANTVLFSAGIVLDIPPRPEIPAHSTLPSWRQ